MKKNIVKLLGVFVFFAYLVSMSTTTTFAVDETTIEEIIPNEFQGGGIAQGWQGDDDNWDYALPFTFNFYGVDYTNIKIGSNGAICLDNAQNCTWYAEINSSWMGPVITALGKDLITNDIFITESSDNVVIRWAVTEYGTSNQINFEVVLYSDGNIKFNYGNSDIALSGGAVVGILKGDGIIYTESVYHQNTEFDQVDTSAWGEFGIGVESFFPADNEAGVFLDTDLKITFDTEIYQGIGNIEIKKKSDNSIVEMIDVTAGQVTGFGTVDITISTNIELQTYTQYYVTVDENTFKDIDDEAYLEISDNTTWNFSTGDGYIIKTISEGRCYEIGSAETQKPTNTELSYSNDNQVTWTYVPEDQGTGGDCNITDVRLNVFADTQTIGENLETEFVGTLIDTQVTNNDDGEVGLVYNNVGTYVFGSTNRDDGQSIVVDTQNNVYIAGAFSDTVDFNQSGIGLPDNHTSTGYQDIFITKYNADSSYGYTYAMGGTNNDVGYDIATDSQDNVYIIGSFHLTVDFNQTGSGLPDIHTSNSRRDIFITKINADGSYGYTYTFGGLPDTFGNNNYGYAIAIDSQDNVYGMGNFSRTIDFNQTGSGSVDNHVSNGYYDIFITKINTDGSYGHTYTMGGVGYDYGHEITTDTQNNVYITGAFSGTVDFNQTGSGSPDSHTSNGSRDIFITKYNADGSYGYTYTMGDVTYNAGRGLVVDTQNNVYITGEFSGTVDFNQTGSGLPDSHTSNGILDIFITKYNPDGSYGYTYTMGGLGYDYGNGVTLDMQDNVYITGSFNNTVDFNQTNGGSSDVYVSNGAYDIFITKINVDGSYGWTNTFGGTDSDFGLGVALDDSNDVLVTGIFKGTVEFNQTGAGLAESYVSKGDYDIFITKYNADGSYGTFFSDSYKTVGDYQVQIAHNDSMAWQQLEIMSNDPIDTNLEYTILDNTCANTLVGPISDTMIDLSSIGNSDAGLCFQTNFTTIDTQVTPQINSWTATYAIERNITDFNFNTISQSTIQNCDCYVIGSAEAEQPENSILYFSKDDGFSWDYIPVDNGGGMDCNVTNVKVKYNDDTREVGEDLEGEFTGVITDTEIVNVDGGEIEIKKGGMGTYSVGTGGEVGYGVVVDGNNNIYVTGEFGDTTDFNQTGVGESDIHTNNGAYDIFITKYNADGSYDYTYTIGSTGDDTGLDIITDDQNNVYITGRFENTVDFNQTGSGSSDEHTAIGSLENIFITKYNADGSYAYTYTIGSTGYDYGEGVVVDSVGNVYMIGFFENSVEFNTTGSGVSDIHTSHGSRDIFITKYNADGSYDYTYTMGGSSYDYGYGIAVDSSDNIYMTGSFSGTVDFNQTGSGASDTHTNNGSRDIFITKYNADGSYDYTYTMGGSSYDDGKDIIIDNFGNAYITGYFRSSTAEFNQTGSGASDMHTTNGSYDIFITKINADNGYGYTYTMGSSQSEHGEGVTVDNLGNVYVTGYFGGDMDFNQTGSGDPDVHAISGGGYDVFITKYNADGSYGYTHTIGDNQTVFGFSITTDNLNNLYTTGLFNATLDFNQTGTGESDIHTGYMNATMFLTKINADGTYGTLYEYYKSPGIYQTKIPSTNIKEWKELTIDQNTPDDTTIKYEILDQLCTNTLINETENTTIDLSSINTINIELCLEITFETTDVQETPILNSWQATYTTDPETDEEEIDFQTMRNPECDLVILPINPVDPIIPPEEPEEEKECKTDNIKEITKDSVTLRVEVDEEYADEKIKFKVEVENLYTNEKETIKLTDKPSDSGRVTLEIDNLEEDTQYRFKVSYQEDDSYEYCPHSKTATTEKTTLGPTKEIVNPECGESSKTYTEDESEFTGDFCQTGEVLNIPEFPNQGESSSWTCTNDDEEITCSASREEKEIVTPPVVQGGSDPEPPAQEVTDPPVQEPTKEQQKEKQYQAAAVVGLTTGTLIALASTTIPLFTTIPMAATDIFIMPFLGILARRKNEQNWGTVFEQTTKQPLPGVKLVLTDIEGFEIETTYSDQHGRFGFLTTNGTYLIHPEKPKYEEDLTHNHDSLYGDVYTGEALTIEENKVLATNIAMNALNINWNEYADKKVKSYTGTFSAIKKWSFIILFYVGFIATAAITYLYPSTLNYIFLSLYMALFIYDNFIKQKKYGTVTKHDKNPVPFAVVSLHNKETNQKTGFAVTDAIGRYYLLAENGDYNMKVKGQPISGQPFEKQGNINVRKGLVREDIKV
ncbi:MAG: SBBP repeat-containing protein [Candidatus Moraniibacteriota bacterium]